MIVLLIFLSQFDVQDKGKAVVVTTEPLAMHSDEADIANTPNFIKMLKKKIRQINLEAMRILDEANMEPEEMRKRLSKLKAQAQRYEVSSNEYLVITKVQ